jgi:hypothetical protein
MDDKKRIITNKPMLGIFAMQFCAESDVTNEEILNHCNTNNLAGTTTGWCRVIRENETGIHEGYRPVECAENPERTHFTVLC